MKAIILRPAEASPTLALADIAGRPLIARQLQWLHANGCDEVAVELGPDADDVRAWLDANGRAFGPRVTTFAAREGTLSDRVRDAYAADIGGTIVIVPGRMIGDGDLLRAVPRCGPGGAIVYADPPANVPGLAGGAVRLWMPGVGVRTIVGPGFCVEIERERDAWALGWAALAGKLPPADAMHVAPIQIHAADIGGGVHLSRGARIAPGARVIGPVLLGERARIEAGAAVGPNVVLGARAAVAPRTTVKNVHVPPSTLVSDEHPTVRVRYVDVIARALAGALLPRTSTT